MMTPDTEQPFALYCETCNKDAENAPICLDILNANGIGEEFLFCSQRCLKMFVNKDGIFNERQLAKALHVCDGRPELIEKMLFKSTKCGIGYYCEDSYIVVSGYCEGDVGECPPIRLIFPFTIDEFNGAVDAADADGCALWDDTHGCEYCNTFDEGAGYGPINKDCKHCGGSGTII
jgi:hypothetical protein